MNNDSENLEEQSEREKIVNEEESSGTYKGTAVAYLQSDKWHAGRSRYQFSGHPGVSGGVACALRDALGVPIARHGASPKAGRKL